MIGEAIEPSCQAVECLAAPGWIDPFDDQECHVVRPYDACRTDVAVGGQAECLHWARSEAGGGGEEAQSAGEGVEAVRTVCVGEECAGGACGEHGATVASVA